MTRVWKPLTIPERAHPLVRRLWEEMNRVQTTPKWVAEAAGIEYETVRAWRTKCSPTAQNLEAAFNVLGMTLKPVYQATVERRRPRLAKRYQPTPARETAPPAQP